jgi:Ca2+-binding RTX toxin-like protein
VRARFGVLVSVSVAVGLLAAGAQSAFAATVDRSGNTLTITGSPGTDEELVVSASSGTVTVDDLGDEPVTAAGTCAPVDESTVTCGNSGPLSAINAALGDGGDVLIVDHWPAGDASRPTVNADGGPGDDELYSGAGDSRLEGGDGADTLGGVHSFSDARFEGANDTLLGGAGSDDFYGGGGNDSMDGGAGTDAASFIEAPGVQVNLVAGSATGDGTDTLAAIEDIESSDGADTIIGDGGANFIVTRKGNDVIRTGGGNDWVNAGRGNDKLNGGAGKDTLQGYEGNDRINARDGQKDKLVSGGTGTDRAKIDKKDSGRTKGVEKVRVR